MSIQFESTGRCFDQSPIPICIIELIQNDAKEFVDFVLSYANEACAALGKMPLSELPGKRFSALFPAAAESDFSICGEIALNGGTCTAVKFSKPLQKQVSIFCYQFSPGCCACVLIDITGKLPASEAYGQSDGQMVELMNSVPGGIAIYRIGSTFETLYFNDGVCALSGHTRKEYAEWVRESATVAVYAEDLPRVMAEVAAAVSEGRMIDISYRINHKTGAPVWVHLSGVKIKDDGIGPIYHAVFLDISQERRALELLLARAEHDELTGLYNRAGFKPVLHGFFENSPQVSAAFIMLDIDNFKAINDAHGHTKGDEVLRRIAAALQEYTSEGDVAARLGGDEFAVFLPYATKSADFMQRLQRLCDITKIEIDGGDFPLCASCSIGACLAPQHGTDFDMLYANADKALFSTKRAGKGHFRLFDDDMKFNSPFLAQNMDWLLDEGSDGVIVSNADTYELLYLNRVARELLCAQEPEPLGKPCYQVLMKQNKPCDFCKIDFMWRDTFLEREVTPDGTDLLLLVKGKLLNWNGITAHIEFVQNNTRRARLSKQIKISEERFHAAISMSDFSVWEYDFATKSIRQSVHSTRCQGGADYIENVPQSLLDSKHYHPDSEREAVAIFDRLAAGEKVVEADLLVHDDKSDSYWWERVRYSTVYDTDGKPLKAIAIGKDVTEEKRRTAP